MAEDSQGPTKHLVHLLLAEGWTVSEIASRLGLSRSTVCFHKRTLGNRIDKRYARRYDWAEIRAHYERGHSMRECREEFGFSQGAWNDAVRRGDIVPRPHGVPVEELFVAGRRRGRHHLKPRLFNAGLRERRCEECGLAEWRGRPLSLDLHHVNGDGLDNRLENLRILCPNCHSQTENWGGRKLRAA